jgi:hypothetical protein
VLLFGEITSDALFEAFGLPHIDNNVLRIKILVDPRRVGQRLNQFTQMRGDHNTKLRANPYQWVPIST